MSIQENVPPGLALRCQFQGHKDVISQIVWSPDGHMLASSSDDNTVRLWDAQTGKHLKTLKGHGSDVYGLAWSPNGQILASGSADDTIRLWNAQTGKHLKTLKGHSDAIYSLAWSPDGSILASSSTDNSIRLWMAQTGDQLRILEGHLEEVYRVAWSPNGQILASSSEDRTVRLWDVQTGEHLRTLTGHSGGVFGVAWLPNGQALASCSIDETIRLWNCDTGRQIRILEGHTDPIEHLSFSFDGLLCASKSVDNTVRLWRTDSWEPVVILEETTTGGYWIPGLAFHPTSPVLATLGEQDMVIRIWELDVRTLLGRVRTTSTIYYTNAKVILVGDSGTGKTGLGLVLTKQPFVPTESTHGRHVWTFSNQKIKCNDGHKEVRETLLWDLAGQPGYRLVHQLHLNEAAVALVVFDSRSETDPFAGVSHWLRALRIAERIQDNDTPSIKKFLVAARIDRGGRSVSHERIDALVDELGFDGYFETSAKEGQNISVLFKAIKNAINWDILPKVTSTKLFQRIKGFLVTEKRTGRVLGTFDDLYRAFLKTRKVPTETKDLPAQFETCIGRVESQGLIRRLSFGSLILLQPELLDIYASALINAVRDEPDGLGSIREEEVRRGNFHVPKDERIQDREQEKLLLIAMIEDLLRYEIALREQSEDGSYLIFPSQSTRENPDLPNPVGQAVVFSFEGPILNIYTTLAVRLSHSGLFRKKELWKNAVTYVAKTGGTYGIRLHNTGEGSGEMTLFFDKETNEQLRFHFEEYIQTHLQRRALSESIRRRRIFVCSECGWIVTEQTVLLRLQRGFNWLSCSVCETKISLLDREERLTTVHTSLIAKMDRTADRKRSRDITASILEGRREIGDFDVFLCHNSRDKSEVKKIGKELRAQGILPWLDEWEIQPGLPWQRLLEQQIEQIKSTAVFVGEDGIGPWQQEELDAFLREFTDRGYPVIPVLLPDAPKEPKLPPFLKSRTWVDFRKQDPDPMEHLIWGITGKRIKIDNSENKFTT